MNWDAVIYWIGWVVAAAGWYMYWAETQAHDFNIRYQVDSYRRLKQMFADYRHENPRRG